MSTINQKNFFVKEVMINLEKTPIVFDDSIFKEVLEEMEKHKLGVVCIISKNYELKAIMTDGDIRRVILNVQKPLAAILNDDAVNYASKNPIVVTKNSLLIDVIKMMGEKKIWDVPILNKKNQLIGLLHLHPAIQKLLKLFKKDN